MATFIITFDVGEETVLKQVKNHILALTKVGEQIQGYCPIHRNALAVKSEKTAKQLRALISDKLDTKDKLFIIRSGVESSWSNSYGPLNDDWLKSNL